MGTFRNRAYWGVAFDRKYAVDRSGGTEREFRSILDSDWMGWILCSLVFPGSIARRTRGEVTEAEPRQKRPI